MTNRLDLRRRLHELAFRQAGYFTAAQAKTAGYAYQAQKYHVDRGNWTRVDRALYRLAEWPTAADDEYARWCVWAEGRGVVSHVSAAEAHDIGDFDHGPVHLTLPPGSRRSARGVEIHIADLLPEDIEHRPSFLLTDLERTLLDLAVSTTTQELLTSAVADAARSGRLSVGELRRRMDAFGADAALRLERALHWVRTEPA